MTSVAELVKLVFNRVIYAVFHEDKTGNMGTDTISISRIEKIDKTKFDFRSKHLVSTKKMSKSDAQENIGCKEKFSAAI